MDLEFDRRFNVNTGGTQPVTGMQIRSRNWIHATAYGPVNETDFVQVLKECEVPFGEFAFVDFGSGKGRAVLLAATFPFAKIIGIEFAEELHLIARNNLGRVPADLLRCRQIELLCMDAAEYQLPDLPVVLFINNPFERPIVARVVENVKQSFASRPRRMLVIYFEPKHAAVWDGVPFLTRVRSTPAIYETKLQV